MRTLKKNCLLIVAGLSLFWGNCFADITAEEAFQKGKDYAQEQKLDESIDELTKSIQLKPSCAAYSFRAYLYLLKNIPDQAILDCNKALEINPRDSQAYNNRAAAYQKKGDYDRAILDCSRAIEINPQIPFCYKNRALSYFKKKEYDKSWQDVHKTESLGFKSSSFTDFIEMLKKASGREK
jgi:tetratricopeptide (TPR) repeat protein